MKLIGIVTAFLGNGDKNSRSLLTWHLFRRKQQNLMPYHTRDNQESIKVVKNVLDKGYINKCFRSFTPQFKIETAKQMWLFYLASLLGGVLGERALYNASHGPAGYALDEYHSFAEIKDQGCDF